MPFCTPEDLPDPGIEPPSPALASDSLPLSHQGSHCDRFIILFTQIIHKQTNTHTHKENIFNVIVQYLEKYNSTVEQLLQRTGANRYPVQASSEQAARVTD